jgi:hypothetical protein
VGLSDGKELIVGTPADGASDRRREGCALPDHGVMLGVRDGSTGDGSLLGKSVGFNEGATS